MGADTKAEPAPCGPGSVVPTLGEVWEAVDYVGEVCRFTVEWISENGNLLEGPRCDVAGSRPLVFRSALRRRIS